MATETTLSGLAAEAYQWFESAVRQDGERFTRLKDGAPEWISELVYDAHGDFLPDDWRYNCIHAALAHLADEGDPDDTHGFADGHVDVYNAARFAWLASNLRRQAYCDEAAEEFGFDSERGITDLIGLGQYAEASEVFAAVVESLSIEVDSMSAQRRGL